MRIMTKSTFEFTELNPRDMVKIKQSLKNMVWLALQEAYIATHGTTTLE